MAKKKSAYLSLLAALLSPIAANAVPVTINFEDVPGGGCLDSGAAVQSGGYNISLAEAGSLIVCDSSTQNRLASNGTNYLSAAATAGTPFSPTFTLTNIGGAAFDLLSIDFAELFENGDFADGANPTGVDIIGNLAAGGSVATSFLLDGFNDGTGIGADFERFVFGAAFTGLSSVVIAGTGAPGFSDIFNILAMDNIEVAATAAVPEPGTLALLGIGLAGMGLARRRRTA